MIPHDTPVGTPVFHDYNLHWIKGPLTSYGSRRLFSVGTGYIETAAEPESCFPCTAAHRRVADAFREPMDRLHRECRGLNFPDVARWMREKYEEAAAAVPPDGAMDDASWATCNRVLDEVAAFVRRIEEAARNTIVDGVRIFR